jgi:hypothetical protein
LQMEAACVSALIAASSIVANTVIAIKLTM